MAITTYKPRSYPVLPDQQDTYFTTEFRNVAQAFSSVRNKVNALAPIATSGSASDLSTGTVPAARLPNPSATTLGGVQSIAAVASKWVNAISTAGVPALTQPAFTDISGTCAVAQGGTGDTGTAWTSYSPSFTCDTGSYTTVSASGYYKTIGKTGYFKIQLNVTDPGTAGGAWNVSLPFNAKANIGQALAGRNATSLIALSCYIDASTPGQVKILKYDGTF